MIDARRDPAFAYLRLDFVAPIEVQELVYPSVACALLAARSQDVDVRTRIATASSLTEARVIADATPVRADWPQIEERSVRYLVRLKFASHPELAERLLDLRDDEIVAETDAVWGLSEDGAGENRLGPMLRWIRGRALFEYAERVLTPPPPPLDDDVDVDDLDLFTNAYA
jgi:predicted NAD-dependent protein-ADP-ribosyltransferase YbiA (DUF1768 family)